MSHKYIGLRDTMPSREVQKEAHRLVGDTLFKLIYELEKLGYDQTKAGFYIHFKS